MASTIKGVNQWATAAGLTLTGTSGNDDLGGFDGQTTLIGGAGDDTYYVKNWQNTIIEQPNGGNDTVVAYQNFTLPANVENLKVLNANIYGVGNDGDNVITGGDGRQQLYGGKGNDTLTGGGGADVFIFRPGDGKDVITDFQTGSGGDMAQIGQFGLYSFADVMARMRQNGSDVILQLGQDDSITFKSHRLADFSAGNFQYGVDTNRMKLTFADEFDTLKLKMDGGPWRTSYSDGPTGHTLASNGELEVYVDRTYRGFGVDPFSVSDGVLNIHAERASAAVQAATGLQYTSGMISSRGSFSQLYGYFEMKAELPAGKGVWPAFWLLPADGSWPPELDVIEAVGDRSTIYHTAHSNSTGKHTQTAVASWAGDITAGMHTYGVLWTKDQLVWYLDGSEVFRTATPPDMNKPMFLLANLAIGGYWPGNPDASFTGADMKIDYIRAYSVPSTGTMDVVSDKSTTLQDGQANLTLTGTAAINGTGNAQANVLTGNAAANILNGGPGNDTLIGHGGNDTLVGGGGRDTVVYAGLKSSYQISRDAQGIVVSSPSTGTDHLIDIARLKFDDGTLAFDVNGNAGAAYRLYKAAFNRAPDAQGLSYWTKALDNNASLTSVSDAFVNSKEFNGLYGGKMSSASLVATLYQNILHRTGDAGGTAFWIDQLNHGMSKAAALAGFSESAENKAGVSAQISDGIWLV
ncbi:DUF4214 domain-containing protein [Rhizobium oryzicola]|uniref:Family 16 glycosylhydrolase n=1 Tax=Rhizobium oryzicola TaxID=1232668 RepID=A0ABT8T1I6_9HYPH|nr:family 16 glycosylhydrolase [Rhizobium oryzicola]MDO1583747.1 family 16 glycosylhydrolase [Rhizobium oryzicola]